MTNHSKNIGSSLAQNRYELGFITILQQHFGKQLNGTISNKFKIYSELLAKKKNISVKENTHLPMMIETIIPESLSMMQLFEHQITKAAQSIQDNMTKESALPEVGKLEAELELERACLQELRSKRVEDEKIMAEKFRLSEISRIQQECVAQEELQQAHKERIFAEETRITQEQKAERLIAVEKAKAEEAHFKIQQQEIAFQKERIQMQQHRPEYHSDSVSEASFDPNDHEGWGEASFDPNIIQETEFSEEKVEPEMISNTTEDFTDTCSEFSDFSLNLDDM